jgi:hypothetical protein
MWKQLEKIAEHFNMRHSHLYKTSCGNGHKTERFVSAVTFFLLFGSNMPQFFSLIYKLNNNVTFIFLAALFALQQIPKVTEWLAESIPWNRFLGSLNVHKFGL